MAQKTYWHLLDRKRIPTEYEVVSSRLTYHSGSQDNFELPLPWRDWYARYQWKSPLVCKTWDQFTDPRHTTYASYTALQSSREVFVDGLLESVDRTGYDRELDAAWVDELQLIMAPFRYPCHGFQMVAAYLGEMAPTGTVTLATLFQAADEIRRIQRFAYRQKQLELVWPGFGTRSKEAWQSAPEWQPLREVVEHLLVTYDWGEALVGLNLVLKPLVDALFTDTLGAVARERGDYVLQQMLGSLAEDCAWQRSWTQVLMQLVLHDAPANRSVINGWIDNWRRRAAAAVEPLASALGAPAGTDARGATAQLDEHLRLCGL